MTPKGTPLSAELLKNASEKVTEATIKKLTDAGIHTLEVLMTKHPKEIMVITGVGKDTAGKLVRLAQKKTGLEFSLTPPKFHFH